jgi:cellulose synthase/poly-beta-1,6-N-acetylglucosamine synthase-like glycosyltransferase
MTPDVLLVLAPPLALLYAAAMALLANGTRKALRNEGKSTEDPFVSVVIAARNEGANIHRCITSVLAGDYLNYELLVVDDSSTDSTVDIVQSLVDEKSTLGPSLTLIRGEFRPLGSGKVNAIRRGINASSGEIIVTLDADCVVKRGWLRSMVACMEKDVGFVAGPVAYRSRRTVFRRLEALEFMSLIGVGAGAIGLGLPLICNSANAAYRRELYGRMQESASLDDFAAADEMLMLYVHNSSEYRVIFCPSAEALVETEGALSVAHFVTQRMRWVSIVRHLPIGRRLALIPVYLFFLLTVLGLVGGVWSPTWGGVAVAALGVKGLADYQVLSPICRHFGRAFLLQSLPLAELLYLPYVLVIAPAGMLWQPVWKGRGQVPPDFVLSSSASLTPDGET